MSNRIPSHARVVIIGGGIVGCSVAYHLCKIGWQEAMIPRQVCRARAALVAARAYAVYGFSASA